LEERPRHVSNKDGAPDRPSIAPIGDGRVEPSEMTPMAAQTVPSASDHFGCDWCSDETACLRDEKTDFARQTRQDHVIAAELVQHIAEKPCSDCQAS
jgi:hypothetical protein